MESRILYHEVMPLEGKKKKKQETSNPFESKRVYAPMVRGEKSGVLTGIRNDTLVSSL